MRAMRPFKDASKCIGVKKHFRGCLCTGYIQALQQQQVAIAAEIRDEDDQGIGFVRRLVPLAEIGGLFAGLRLVVDDCGALHPVAAMNVEVGAFIRNCCPWIAAYRAKDHGIRILQIIETKIARKAEEDPLGFILRQCCQPCDNLQIAEIGKLLRAHVCCAVGVHGGSGRSR